MMITKDTIDLFLKSISLAFVLIYIAQATQIMFSSNKLGNSDDVMLESLLSEDIEQPLAQQAEEQEQEEQPEDAPAEEATEASEQKAEGSSITPSSATPNNTKTQATKQPTASKQPAQKRPTDKYLSEPQPPVQDTPNGRHYDTLWYYAQDYMGVCPSQRPKWNDGKNHPMISVGVWTTPGNALNSYIEQMWDHFLDDGAYLGDVYIFIHLGNLREFVNSCANNDIGLELTWSTRTIRWVDVPGMESVGQIRDNKSPERLAELDGVAAKATNYLRWLDNTYKARCPNG